MEFNISPGYFHAAGTALLTGRAFTWHDDKNSPRVAVVNQEFARRIFGSEKNAVGSYYKMPDGTRVQVVGIAEDGKYNSLTEDPRPAMFLPDPAIAVELDMTGGAFQPRSAATGGRHKEPCDELDPGLPVDIQTRYQGLEIILFGPRMATIVAGRAGRDGRNAGDHRHLRNGRVLGQQAAPGAGNPSSPRRAAPGSIAGRAWDALSNCSRSGRRQDCCSGILASRVLAYLVYQATPRDPLVLAGVVLVMLLLGLLATWIPARRALSVNPMMLLRED